MSPRITQPSFDELQAGDCVKARVANERLWFVVERLAGSPANGVVCRLDSHANADTVFDGRVTLDREWIIDTARREKPALRVVA